MKTFGLENWSLKRVANEAWTVFSIVSLRPFAQKLQKFHYECLIMIDYLSFTDQKFSKMTRMYFRNIHTENICLFDRYTRALTGEMLFTDRQRAALMVV